MIKWTYEEVSSEKKKRNKSNKLHILKITWQPVHSNQGFYVNEERFLKFAYLGIKSNLFSLASPKEVAFMGIKPIKCLRIPNDFNNHWWDGFIDVSCWLGFSVHGCKSQKGKRIPVPAWGIAWSRHTNFGHYR